jgi:hypothetical protein
MKNAKTTTPYTSQEPFEAERIHAAAIYCSDGRYGDQMDEFLHRALDLPRYDRLAIPGGAACLAPHIAAQRDAAALEKQLRFLIQIHELSRVVLIAHQECAFYKDVRLRNATLQEYQFKDLAVAAARIASFSQNLKVEAYFAGKHEGFVRFEPVPV